MQGDVKESSDFFVPCSGVEIFLYLLCKHHQHGPHHKALILHVNAMDKLPAQIFQTTITDKTSQVLPSTAFP